MSKYTQTNTGRPYSEVRGYLRGTLDAATVATNVLTPKSVEVAVYALDPDDVWRYIGEAIVWNYDESLTGIEGMYCRASFNSDGRFEVYWLGCDPTALTVPEPPGE